MHLKIYHDKPDSSACSSSFDSDNILARLKSVDEEARRNGLSGLDPAKEPLVALGMEQAADGTIAKNSFGIFHLSWLAEQHPDWPAKIEAEAAAIRATLQATHGVPLRFLIWAGMGGSAEDKALYNRAGLLRKGPKVYVLDSTDPAKLKNILADMTTRSGLSVKEVLKSTLVVAMALGMTSYEPVVNLQMLTALYEKHKVPATANFLYMTLPGSILDQFAGSRGYLRMPLQLDEGNSTSGRHSSPLTRGSLLPLALAKVDIGAWMAGTFLSKEQIAEAWRLSGFLDTQGKAGRDKITLLCSKPFAATGIWTKQNFEESLGKSESIGLKVVTDEKIKLSNYRPPKDALQDRIFLVVLTKGIASDPVLAKATLLRRAGYPVATVTFEKDAPLSQYMQFMHYVVFGIGWLRKMNFVTQPSVELYKAITSRVHSDPDKRDWNAMQASSRQAKWRGGVTLYYDKLKLDTIAKNAAEVYSEILKKLFEAGRMKYGELTFFGDTRYSDQGRSMRRQLDKAGEVIFRRKMKVPVDVYEGPAMNHSFHEMIIGHGKCFSTVVLCEKAEKVPGIEYSVEYHRAQFLATQMALQERGRDVVAIIVKDLEAASMKALGEFFHQVAQNFKGFDPLKCYHR